MTPTVGPGWAPELSMNSTNPYLTSRDQRVTVQAGPRREAVQGPREAPQLASAAEPWAAMSVLPSGSGSGRRLDLTLVPP